MRRGAIAVLALLFLLPPLTGADDPVLAQATGALVFGVDPDGQAAEVALQVGDIVVRYAGERVETVAALGACIQARAGQTKDIVVVINRDGTERSVLVGGGSLGVALRDIEAGVALPDLPPQTVTAFDLSALRLAPSERWCRFLIDDEHVGFLHDRLALDESDLLRYRAEIAFDGGERYGRNHFRLQCSAALVEGRLQFRRLSFSVPHSELQYRCWRVAPAGRRAVLHWELAVDDMEDTGRLEPDLLRERVLPTYLINRLAACLPATEVAGETAGRPPQERACLHLRELIDGEPRVGQPVALCAVGHEPVLVDERELSARLVELHYFGRRGNRHWVLPDGRIWRSDFGGGSCQWVADRAAALEGLPKDLVRSVEDF